MESESPNLDAILGRLQKVERQNRALKRSGLALLTVTCAALCSILLIGLMGAAPASKEVEASAFILKDGSGAVRAKLFMDKTGPSLSLYDAVGGRRASLGEFGEGEGLMFYNNPSERYGGVSILLLPDGPSVVLSSAKHGEMIGLDNEGAGPNLKILDSKGFSAEIGVSNLVTPTSGGTRRTSAASIMLFGKDGKVIWSAP